MLDITALRCLMYKLIGKFVWYQTRFAADVMMA